MVALVWINDEIGYRCPRCALYVAIPKQDNAACPDCDPGCQVTVLDIPQGTAFRPVRHACATSLTQVARLGSWTCPDPGCGLTWVHLGGHQFSIARPDRH